MIYEGGKIEGINAAEALRLMIKQIAGPLRILSGAEAAAAATPTPSLWRVQLKRASRVS